MAALTVNHPAASTDSGSAQIYQPQANVGSGVSVIPNTVGKDLMGVSVQVLRNGTAVTGPVTGQMGETVTVRWTVTNIGSTDITGTWFDDVVLSTDTNIDYHSDGSLNFRSHNGLTAGSSYTQTADIVLNKSGALYLGVDVDSDNGVAESDETNNDVYIPITITTPNVDLVVQNPTAPATATVGQQVSYSFRVANTGADATTAASTSDSVYLSPTSTYNSSTARYLTSVTHSGTVAAGGFYDVAGTFTVPDGPGGSYYLIFKADDFAQQGETSETNNVAAVPISLTPVNVDLQVTNLQIPATAGAGSTVSISYTVKNSGTQAATGNWFDSITLLSGSTSYILTAVDASAYAPLAAGASYTVTRNVSIPAGASLGSGTITVAADYSSGQPETDGTNNSRSGTLSITQGNLPNLQVTSASISPSGPLIHGSSVTVTWTVTNTGTAAATADRYDSIYLSTNGTLETFTDTDLRDYSVTDDLAPGASQTFSATVSITGQFAGAANILVVADSYNYELEGNENDNVFKLPVTVQSPDVDLVLSSPVAPATVVIGDQIPVQFTVTNVGTAATSGFWYDHVYVSSDATLDAFDSDQGSFYSSAVLQQNGSYQVQSTLQLSDFISTGSKYLIFATNADGEAGETNYANNYVAIPVTIQNPTADLVLSDLVAPATAPAGSVVNVSYKVTNAGTTPASANWYDEISIRLGGSFITYTDVDRSAIAPLAPGASVTVTGQLTIPASADLGTRSIFVETDVFRSQPESNNDNNTISRNLEITQGNNADLIVSSASGPASAVTGDTINVTYTVSNQGTSSTLANFWYDAVYLSTDATLGSGDVLISGSYPRTSPVAASGSYSVTRSLTIPNGFSGDGYLIFVTDSGNAENETDETNNTYATPFSVSGPDLVLSGLNGPANAALGDQINVSYTVTNQGSKDFAGSAYDQFYLSTDSVLDANDISIGYLAGAGVLASGGSTQVTGTLTLPSGPIGNVYLIAVANTFGSPEAVTTNNTIATPITLTGADLTVSTASLPNNNVVVGQTATVNYTVHNSGNASASAANLTDGFYLSNDAVFDSNDVYITTQQVADSTLGPGGNVNRSATITIPNTSVGAKYIIVRADVYDGQPESNNDNNYYAIPINVSAPDLAVTSISAPATAKPGDSIAVSWTIKNQGAADALLQWSDVVYFSGDALLDTSSDFFATSNNNSGGIPLAAGASYTVTVNLTVPNYIPTGNQFLIVEADGFEQTTESNETNNSLARGIQIVAPDLKVENLTAPTTANSGQTITVNWNTANRGTAPTTGDFTDRVELRRADDGTLLTTNYVTYDASALGALAFGSSVARSATITIPDGAPGIGNLKVVVISDYFGNQSEGSAGELNNSAETTLTSAASPYPDLQVTNFTVPTGLQSGQQVTVNWNLLNSGNLAVSAAFFDRLIVTNLSTGSTIASATIAYDPSAPGKGSINAGASVARSATVTLPVGAASVGDLQFTLTTDSTNQIFEYNAQNTAETNNDATVTRAATLAPYPDLQVTDLAASGNLEAGKSVTLTWKIHNSGDGPVTVDFQEGVTVTNTDTGVGLIGFLLPYSQAVSGVIAPGADIVRQATFTLPDSLASVGNLTFMVSTDALNNVAEFSAAGTAETNNSSTVAGVATLGAHPDLQVAQIAPPTDAKTGQQSSINWTVQNAGNKAVSSGWTDHLLIRNLDTGETIGEYDIPYDPSSPGNGPLAAGGSINRQFSFTLPDGPPGAGAIEYTITTDSKNNVVELTGAGNGESNNTATATAASTLSPYPDLTVSNISGPATVVSGNQIEVRWTTTNQGTIATARPFTERVYLSTDGTASEDDLLLGQVTFNGNLAVGASIDHIQDFTLPLEFSGSYNILVVTDYFSQITEVNGAGDAEINNTGIGASPVTVTLAPAPNLKVSAVQAPATASSGQQALISWTVTNSGQTATIQPYWLDSVFISLDQTLDPEDIFLGSVSNQSYLDVGQSYNNSLNVTIPNGYNGPFYILVDTDAKPNFGGQGFKGTVTGVVRETSDDDNLTSTATPTLVTLTPPPDLQVTSIVAPAHAFSGKTVSVSFTVTNKGPGPTPISSWLDRVFLSTDSTLDVGDLQLKELVHAPTTVQTTVNSGGSSSTTTQLVGGFLAPGESYTGTAQVTLPEGQSGDYYFLVQTDATNLVYEQPLEGNNVGLSAIQVALTPPPDLIVSSVVAPANGLGSRNFQLSYTVTNAGASRTPQPNWVDEVYLSKDQVLDDSDIQVVSTSLSTTLNAGDSYTNTVNFTAADGLVGRYFVIVVTDARNAVFELNNANNSGVSAIATNFSSTPADLLTSSATVTSTAQTGGKVRVSYTVVNAGVGDTVANKWSDQVIISKDAVYGNDDDRVLGSLDHSGLLAPGGSYFNSALIDIPMEIATGDYHIFVVANGSNSVFEAGATANNVSAPQPLTITQVSADLQVTSITAPSTISTRQPFTVNWTVQNTGTAATNLDYVLDAVYLSRTPTLTSDAINIGSLTHLGVVPAGGSYTSSATFTLPVDLSGAYYVIVRTNETPRFQSANFEAAPGDANNVTASAGLTTVTPSPVADLAVQSVTAPASIVGGQHFNVSFTVRNLGAATADSESSWSDFIYASRDGIFDPENDIFLGYRTHTGGLAANGVYSDTASITMPAGLSGDYTIFVVTDASDDRVYERGNEANNVLGSPTLTNVTVPPPADLVAGTITIPSNGVAGQSATITYTVSNNGLNPALGDWDDSIYLSRDGQFDLGDLFFGTVHHEMGLAVGGSYTETLTAALPGLAPGNYQVLVRSDIRNQVPESNEANNFEATLNSVVLTVQGLTLGTETRARISSGVAQYYRVDVPAGETLLFHFDAANNSSVNQLFVSYGKVPTRSNFDYRSDATGDADQDLIVPATQAGTYYILAYGVAGESLSSNDFGLTASLIPFGVRSVDPGSVGNAGASTLALTGARFDSGTTFHLIAPGGAVLLPTRVVLVDASHAYATFDFTGKPVGAYSVQAIAGDGSTATLAAGLNVTVGLGANVVASIHGPQNVLIGHNAPFFIDYTNTGDADASVPFFIIQNVHGTPLVFGLDGLNPDADDEPNNTSTSLQLLAASNGALGGTLRPGEHRQIPFYYFVKDSTPIEFDLLTVTADDTRALDYGLIEKIIRDNDLVPDSVANSPSAFATVFSQLKTQIGATFGDYVKMLGRNADVLPASLGLARDALPLLALEVQRALAATGPSISGRLTSADTTVSLADRSITARSVDTGDVYNTVSLRDGSFIFDRLPAGTYNLFADGALVLSGGTAVVSDQPVTGINVALDRGATLSGRVSGPASGQGTTVVAGAALTLTSTDTVSRIYSVLADSSGNYSFAGLAPGSYRLSVTADGYTRANVGSITIATNRDAVARAVSLTPAASLSGSFVLQAGGPADATVAVTAFNTADPTLPENIFTGTVTDSDFSIGNLPAGSYKLTFVADGYLPVTINATVTAGQSLALNSVALSLASTVSGTLTSTDSNNTVADKLVGLYQGDTLIASGTTDSTGAYQISDVAPGSYTLKLVTGVLTGGFVTPKTLTIVQGNNPTAQNLLIQPGAVLAGVVHNTTTGAVLPGVEVFATNASGQVASAFTDANGRYQFRGVDLGAYRLALAVGAPANVSVTSLDGRTFSADLSIAAAATLGGRLLDSGGQPVDGMVTLVDANGNRVAHSTTDANGNFLFLLQSAGVYTLLAVSPDGAFAPATAISVGAGQSVVSNLTAGDRTLAVTVRDAANAFAQGAVVAIDYLLPGGATVSAGSGVVGADGAVTFAHLAPGTYLLTAVGGASGNQAARQQITVSASGPATASVALAVQSTLTGHVTAAGGAVGGADVLVVDPATGALRGQAQTDAQGLYTISAVAAGTYDVYVLGAGYQFSLHAGLVVPAGGVNQTSDFALTASTTTITGHVQDATGLAIGLASVAVFDAQGHLIGRAVTDATGAYTVSGASGSNLSIYAVAEGHSSQVKTGVNAPASGNTNLAAFSLPTVALGANPTTLTPHLTAFQSANQTAALTPASGSGGNLIIPLLISIKRDPDDITADMIPEPCPEAAKDIDVIAAKIKLLNSVVLEHDAYENAQAQQSLLRYQFLNYTAVFALSAADLAGQVAGAIVAVLVPAGELLSQASGKVRALQGASAELTAFNDAEKFSENFDLANDAAGLYAAYKSAFEALNNVKTGIGELFATDDPSTDLEIAADLIGKINIFLGAAGPLANSAKNLAAHYGSEALQTAAGSGAKIGSLLGGVGAIIGLVATFQDAIGKINTLQDSLRGVINARDAYLGAKQQYQTIVARTNVLFSQYLTLLRQHDCNPKDPRPSHNTSHYGGPRGGGGSGFGNDGPGGGTGDGNGTGGGGGGGGGSGSYSPTPRGSRDPNDLIGPTGVGTDRFVSISDTLGYTIEFENAADATAPAQKVTITQQLDPDLDYRTFRLDDFGYGDLHFELPGTDSFYSAQFDYSADRGYILDVFAFIDVETGVATWTLTALDPKTGLQSSDPSVGFLPPDDGTGAGQGFVSYTVRAKSGDMTGTRIDAVATVVFDNNPPINTPATFNTIDASAPTSAVNPLPTHVGNPEFLVSWQGTDPSGSALASFDVYVSTNGGPAKLFLTQTNQRSATFRGEIGDTYSFYTVARDFAGNVQPVNTIAAVSTTVSGGGNTLPTVEGDRTFTINEDSGLTHLGITAPTDVDGDTLLISVTAVPDPSKGVFAKADGSPVAPGNLLTIAQLTGLTFTPYSNLNGSAGVFSYNVNDGHGSAVSQTITVQISPVNDNPVVQADKTITRDEDSGPVDLGITTPTDVDGDALAITVTAIPATAKGQVRRADGTVLAAGATLTLAQLTGLQFFPAQDANGAAGVFTYSVDDGHGGLVSQTITLTLNPVNDAPVTQANKTVTLLEDAAPTSLGITTPTDVDGDALTFTVTTLPTAAKGQLRLASGTAVTLNSTLSVSELAGLVFVPALNANGAAGNFTYTVSDGHGGTATQTVTLQITPVNDVPVVDGNKTITLLEDAAATSLAIGAPTDVDGDTLTVTVTGLPTAAKGVVQLATGTPVANGATLTAAQLAGLVFVPSLNANGAAGSFSYSVDDGNGGIVSQTVTLSITPVNDLPVLQGNKTVTVLEDAAATALAITAPTDVDGDTLTITVTSVPTAAKGVVQLANGTPVANGASLTLAQLTGLVFIPAPDANGAAGAFVYSVNDGNGGLVSQTVTLAITPVNDNPVVQGNKTITLLEDAAPTSLAIAAPTDVDGDQLTITVTSVPTAAKGQIRLSDNTVVANGAVLTLAQLSGLVFVPSPNANGAAGAFSYSVNDGNGGVVSQSVTLNITPVNDAPTVPANRTLTVLEDSGLTALANVAPTDVDGDALTITVTAVPDAALGAVRRSSGTVVQLGDVLTIAELTSLNFQTVANANGSGSFAYAVTDGNGGAGAHTLTIQVTPENDAPVTAPDKMLALDEDSGSISLGLTAPTDVENDPLTITVTAIPGARGEVRLSTGAVLSVGSRVTVDQLAGLVFVPTLNANGTATFAYSVSDGQGGSASQTVTLAITPVNDAPVVPANGVLNVLEDSGATDLGIAPPTDVDNDSLTITVTSIPDAALGSIRLGSGGSAVSIGQILLSAQLTGLVFIPASNANGAAGAFAYSVTDGHGGSAAQSLTLGITPVNDAPVVDADKTVNVTLSQTSATLDISAPTDVDSDPLTITVTELPTFGSIQRADHTPITLGATLTAAELSGLSFVPGASTSASAGAFRYSVSDGTDTVSQSISLTVQVRQEIAIGKKLTLVDSSGDHVTLKLSGPGTLSATLVNGEANNSDLYSLHLTGATAKTSVTVTTQHGGSTNVGSFISDSSIKGLTFGPGVSVGAGGNGEVTIAGNLGALKIGGALSAEVTAAVVGSLSAASVDESHVEIGGVGKVTIAGAFTDSHLSAVGNLGKVAIKGSVTHSDIDGASLSSLSAGSLEQTSIDIGGRIGSITVSAHGSSTGVVGSTVLAGQSVVPASVSGLNAAGIGKLTIAGALTDSQIAAVGNIGAVSIKGSSTLSLIAAGGNAGADGLLGTGDEHWNAAAKISSVAVTGAFTQTSLVAGIDPGADFVWGDHDDVVGATLAGVTQGSSIGPIKLGAASAIGNPVFQTASAEHTAAIISLLLKTISVGKTKAPAGVPSYIDANGDGAESGGEVIIKTIV